MSKAISNRSSPKEEAILLDFTFHRTPEVSDAVGGEHGLDRIKEAHPSSYQCKGFPDFPQHHSWDQGLYVVDGRNENCTPWQQLVTKHFKITTLNI